MPWISFEMTVLESDVVIYGWTLHLSISSSPLCKMLNTYLNNYFDFHVCLSIRLSVVPSVRGSGSVRPNLTSIPASVTQNVTNKSCLVCVKSEKYASWVALKPQWDRCRRGEAEVRILDFKTTWSEFQKANQTTTKQDNTKRISKQNLSLFTSPESVPSSWVRKHT